MDGCRVGAGKDMASLVDGWRGQLMAGPSDRAACPVCGPGIGVQPHRASFQELPTSAA